MMVFAGRASARGMGRAISGALSGGIILASLVAFGWVASGALKATDILSHARWTPFVAAVILQFSMMIFFMLLWERLLFFLWRNRSGIAVKAVRPASTSLTRQAGWPVKSLDTSGLSAGTYD
jgi:hypothetical protein